MNAVDNKKNKSKILVIILIVIIILLVSFIGYDKLISKRSKCNVKEEILLDSDEEKEEIKFLDIYSDQVQELYNNVFSLDCGKTLIYKNGTVTRDKILEDSYSYAVKKLEREKGELVKDGDYSYKRLKKFTYEELSDTVKKIFGKDTTIEAKEYSGCPIYKYDQSTKTYTLDEEKGCGCTTGPEEPIITLYKATSSDDEINLYQSVVYVKLDKYENKEYYKDNLYNIKIGSECMYNPSNKKCIDSSTKYKFTFKLEGKNYVFTNVSKVNE